ncbi:hypothetical protein [Rhodoplanes sp. Z2-YC6860]|uniref:hypothetical protein n=1 Tax=Rhodoplanes sp. Z2-YC6860 TaxID=674703 RepID=UPI00082AF449|nr:hypothetical protein [Rhodoplanes sp. Z2-YC6860]
MADDSKIVAIADFAHLQSKAAAVPETLPEEGLRLLRAFLRIRDPRRRTWLVQQSEQIANLQSTMR